MHKKLNIRFYTLFVALVFSQSSKTQVLYDNPCTGLPAGSEITANNPCVNVSTAGMTPLFNPGSCNSGGLNDGWVWFTGTGGNETITFAASTGDPVLHVFEFTDPAACIVTELGCADNTFTAGTETVSVTTTAGSIYLIRLQNWGTNTSMSGCLELQACPGGGAASLTDNPCSLPAGAQWPTDGSCVTVSTCGMTHLFDPASCGSGVFNDGWAWFPGTNSLVDLSYQPGPGEDAIIHAFSDDGTCSVTEEACSNSGGAGAAETVTFTAVAGVNYFIRIQSNGNNNELSGCMSITPQAPNCNDLIQNGSETGVDCGGGCPTPCATNACSNTPNTTLGVITCSIVGTPGFNTFTNSFSFTGNTQFGAPTPTPTCGPNWNGSGNYTSWANIDLDPGVTSMALDLANVPFTASDDVYLAYYQGTSCASMNYIGCETFALNDPIAGLILQPVMVQNLDPNLPLYILLYSNDPFNFVATPLGFAGEPTNTDCGNAINNSAVGCNAGAVGDPSFTPPSNISTTLCTGGTWYSNENTVYYSFTPTATNADLQIENVLCNDGTSGLAQFAVWESCGDVGTYGSAFLGCVVGAANLSLTGLTVGQTYIIVVDGNAGDICQWEFTGNNILLPLEFISFDVNYNEPFADLKWVAKEKGNSLSYEIQRSINGFDFERISTVEAKSSIGNTTYQAKDLNPIKGQAYYRLKQIKVDGSFQYSNIISLEVNPYLDRSKALIYPNPAVSNSNSSIYFESEIETTFNLKIMNANGQVLIDRMLVSNRGTNVLELPASTLSKGLYSVTLTGNGHTQYLRMVIN